MSSQHRVQGEGEGLGAGEELGTCCSWTCSSSLLEGKGRCALVSSRNIAVNRLEYEAHSVSLSGTYCNTDTVSMFNHETKFLKLNMLPVSILHGSTLMVTFEE